MLQLKNIVKTYVTGDLKQYALKDVSISFRKNEFVSILGQSGSGKTTMLNIIGGLDRYDSGDLIINGVSTKNYKDRDWDTYRNHTIGFVFQSYNLIPHQTVLANVELALTIGGISKRERKRRALAALEEVGLKEQAHKRPNQMSGGQMQRVAIARALVNNPDVLLADEPTGALDTETSVQVMELLKKVANDRLVIMVTHNPELAKAYSTRIVKLKDGVIIGDTAPFHGYEEKKGTAKQKKQKKAAMSVITAFSLSFNNLLTKKGRTILTSFAGSIGIIGIALILSLSTGFQNYIDQIQEDTLTSYPLTITAETADTASLLLAMTSDSGEEKEGDVVVEQQYISTMFSKIGRNDLTKFKSYLEKHEKELDEMISLVDYKYSVSPNIYTISVTGEIIQVNPSSMLSNMGMGGAASSSFGSVSTSVFNQMIDDPEMVQSQYDVLAGRWPEMFDEVILVLPEPNAISDLLLYSLGLRDSDDMKDMMAKLMAGEKVETTSEPLEFTYEELMNVSYKLIDAADTYRYNEEYDIYESMVDDAAYMQEVYDNAVELKIVGVVCASEDSSSSSLTAGIGYTKELTEYVSAQAEESEIVQKQLADESVNVFSNKRFDDESTESGLKFEDMISVDTEALSSAFGVTVNEDDISSMTEGYMGQISSAITTDTSAAETMVSNTLATLATGMLTDYIEENKDPVTNAAILKQADVEDAVADYMRSDTAQTMLANMENEYLVPAANFESVYTELLNGMLQAYIGMSAVDQEDPSAVLMTEMVEPLVEQFIAQEAITEVSSQLGHAMTEAVMQKTILTAVGSLTGELVSSFSNAFHVDENAIASAFSFDMSEEELTRLIETMTAGSTEQNASTNLTSLGYQDLNEPTSIAFYFKDFESKELFLDFLEEYNEMAEDEEDEIKYTDITGILMSSVKTIVDSVSYVLIAFVSISLVVSSIMIGIITYISVLERTKEIGVLRAIGASKKNISSIFNAETFIVGLCSGLLGIGVTLAAVPVINHIIHSVTGNTAINAQLPAAGGTILVILSVVLTLIGGLIPSKQAAKKDPVMALRSE